MQTIIDTMIIMENNKYYEVNTIETRKELTQDMIESGITQKTNMIATLQAEITKLQSTKVSFVACAKANPVVAEVKVEAPISLVDSK